MTDHIKDFIDFMRGHGIGPKDHSEIVDDDQIHRYALEDDKPRVKTGSYRLASDGDGFAYGWCQSFKEGVTHSFHTKSKRKWSSAEKEAHKRKADAAKKENERKRKEAADQSRKEALELWQSASKTGYSEYLTSKGITLRGVRYSGDVLLVPMWRDGEIVSVQRILPDGTKLFMKGSDHVGAYFSIRGEPDTLAICEGVSTGASVAEATGWSVICAFNAGNLKPVAKTMRERYPESRIIFAADNDHAVKKSNGDPWNPGIEKAQQAAVAIGGEQVVAPPSEQGITDWNDVQAAHGIDAVRDGLMSVPIIDRPSEQETDNWEPDYDVIEDPRTEMHPLDAIMPLGHNRGTYYFLPQSTGQIMSMTATALGRAQNLYMLAPKGFWERLYAPEDKMSVIADYASAELIAECHRKGIFQPENVRGVGAWQDSGKLLVNCGDVIVGEGVRCHPSEYRAKNVYEAGPRVINLDAEPLTNAEGSAYRDLCKSLSWKRPQYADLVAGWTVISMIGGVLTWRPHIVVTGPKGSGKSTVMDYIIKKAVGSIAVCLDGGTTEAGVRKNLGCSSRPFIMDEAESESKRDMAEMQKIFFLFRRASSGAKVGNAYDTFVIRSCACFAAINPRLEHGADKDRNTVLELFADRSEGSAERWAKLQADMSRVMTDDFSARLMARTVANMDVLLENIKVFVTEAAGILGSMRAADQVGPMIAGAYSLVSDKRVTPEFAREWMQSQDWDWHTDTQEGTDSEKMVQRVLATRIRYDVDGIGREGQIAEMIDQAYQTDHTNHINASKGLLQYGIRVIDDHIVIGNNVEPIRTMLRETPWADYRRTLSNHPRADNYGNKPVRFGGLGKMKATALPISEVVDVRGVSDDDGWTMEGFE